MVFAARLGRVAQFQQAGRHKAGQIPFPQPGGTSAQQVGQLECRQVMAGAKRLDDTINNLLAGLALPRQLRDAGYLRLT